MATVDENDDDLLGNSSSSDQADDKITADEDELLLLSSPTRSTSPKPQASAEDSSNLGQTNTDKVNSGSAVAPDVVDLVDDLDLEILEEVTSIPDVSMPTSSEESLEESEEEEESDDGGYLDGKMNIFHDHGAFFLWNADDAQMLREECRIVGKLIGCLPRAPRQNVQLGLPLQLMPEEAKLLVDIDAAVIVKERPASDRTCKMRKAAFENVRQQNFQIQQRLYKKNRQKEVGERMDAIIAGKKAKKRKLLEAEERNGKESGVRPADISDHPTDDSKEEKASGEGNEADSMSKDDDDLDNLTVDDIVTTETSEGHAFVQLFTENPWKQNISPYLEWTFPNTERDLLRYYVFKDLWGKGFFLTSGSKFGGDFLVYPGDPARYHSHYIAVCRSQFDEMPCLDLVSLGRLAANVRKTALLCALDRNRKVTYTSLTWTGMI